MARAGVLARTTTFSFNHPELIVQSQAVLADPPYACPRTGAPLLPAADRLEDAAGTVAYPLRDGIPQFLRFPPIETPQGSAQLDRLNELAGNVGWQDALQTLYASDPALLRYITDVDRSKFLRLLPLRPDSRVLEVGPGLGQITSVLAPRVGSVCALEVVPGQAQFVQQRCRQQGLTNVHVAVGGDDCRLPYADESFDLIVLNLVFEWCASRCESEDPESVQRRLLSELARVLKAGGSLYLATKNRFALRYLIGKPDEHVHNMRFGNALPRWLTRLLLRLRGSGRAPGLLHSYGALADMLRTAGFTRLQPYWATPEIRYPTEYVPIDASAIRAARSRRDFEQGESRSTRALMPRVPASWVKYVMPGLTFLATKAEPDSGRAGEQPLPSNRR
jgi:SAM-dependent methyltransferase